MLPKYIIAILVILSLLSVGGIITTTLFATRVINPYSCEDMREEMAENCIG